MSNIGPLVQVKRARKNHVCWWCAEAIEKGESYDKWCWVDDKPNTVKAHPECRIAWGEDGFYEAMFGEGTRPKSDERRNNT